MISRDMYSTILLLADILYAIWVLPRNQQLPYGPRLPSQSTMWSTRDIDNAAITSPHTRSFYTLNSPLLPNYEKQTWRFPDPRLWQAVKERVGTFLFPFFLLVQCYNRLYTRGLKGREKNQGIKLYILYLHNAIV